MDQLSGFSGFLLTDFQYLWRIQFYKDAKLLRITRYRYNNIPVDSNGKYYYIHDGEEIWNPGSMPSKTPLDSYECHHGIGYSRFLSSKNGLKADLLAFVPVNSTCEINKLTLTNTTDAPKTFSLFPMQSSVSGTQLMTAQTSREI